VIDEHGWNERGVFNFEGGCYAKISALIGIEPLVWSAIIPLWLLVGKRPIGCSRRGILDSSAITDQRACILPAGFYSITNLLGKAGTRNIIFLLTADAFGVLPP
jgi:phosphoenolpyruvate carboxykinase (ATP)